MPRKILIATSTRADWGLLSPVATALRCRPSCEVTVMATNMHLDPTRGNTLNEIRRDGFDPVLAPMPVSYSSGADAALAMSIGASSATEVIDRYSPDVIVILGDRFEMLSVATVAAVMKVPIIHIAGGEITEGAFDDGFRHAITKLSALHLTATEAYRRRVIQLGEEPERVINTGAIGVISAADRPPFTRQELERDLCWEFGEKSLLVTVHPETLSTLPTLELIGRTLDAIDRFPQVNVLFTYPNNDPDGEMIIRAINSYAYTQPRGRVMIIPSLGRMRYHSALHCVTAVVGNSSSGIVEVPSAGIPTVDIGNRQRGRLAASSVIHTPAETDSIISAIERALEMDCSRVVNPYSQPNTLHTIVDAIADTPMADLRRPKRFFDLNQL